MPKELQHRVPEVAGSSPAAATINGSVAQSVSARYIISLFLAAGVPPLSGECGLVYR